jgi:hypothetical protein
MENNKTAVEWLVSQIAGMPSDYIIDGELYEIKEKRYNLLFNLDIDITPLVEQAKQMEKEQIKKAYKIGVAWGHNNMEEYYYSETYNKKDDA